MRLGTACEYFMVRVEKMQERLSKTEQTLSEPNIGLFGLQNAKHTQAMGNGLIIQGIQCIRTKVPIKYDHHNNF